MPDSLSKAVSPGWLRTDERPADDAPHGPRRPFLRNAEQPPAEPRAESGLQDSRTAASIDNERVSGEPASRPSLPGPRRMSEATLHPPGPPASHLATAESTRRDTEESLG